MDMRVRFTEDDAKGMKELTSRVGPQVWDSTVFVLTFANEVKPPPQSSKSHFWYYVSFGYYNAERDEKLELFKKLLSEWEETIRKSLECQNALTDDLSIVPTGYRDSNPPDCMDWLTNFWCEAFWKTSEASQPAFLGINLHRMNSQPSQGSGDPTKKSESSEQIENRQQTVKVDLEEVAAVVKFPAPRKTLGLTGLLGAAIGTPTGLVVAPPEEEEDFPGVGFGLVPIIEAIQKYESTKSLKRNQ